MGEAGTAGCGDGAHSSLLRGDLEGDEVNVVGTAGLAVVGAVAVGVHDCAVHSLVALVQGVPDGPVGAVVLAVSVAPARGELAVGRGPEGPLDHGAPVGHAAADAAGVRVAAITREHAQRARDDAAPDGALPVDLDRRGRLHSPGLHSGT